MLTEKYYVEDVVGAPTCDDDFVYFLQEDNQLVCCSIHEEGLMWSTQLNEKQPIGSELPTVKLLNNDRLIVLGECNFWVLDRRSGVLLFQRSGGQLDLSISIQDHLIYGFYYDAAENLLGFKLHTESFECTEFSIANEKLFNFGGVNHDQYLQWEGAQISGASYQTGQTIWSHSVAELGRHERFKEEWIDGEVVGPPVVYKDLAIFNIPGHHLVALNSITGQLAWKLKLADRNCANNLSIDGDVLLVTGYFYYCEIAALNGTFIKSKATADWYNEHNVSLIEKHFLLRDTIVLLHGRTESSLTLIDRGRFDIRQTVDLEGKVGPSFVSYSDTAFVVRDLDGILTVFSIGQ